MLPNFRRSEPEASDTNASPLSPFQPRPFLSVPRSTGEAPKSISIIGAGLTITGNLTCKGEVQIEGVVEGDVQGSNVVIGEDATVTGSISGEEVIVRGHVVGSVRGRRVMLQTTSQVEGDIYHQSLSIEQGALFEGKSRRTKDDPRIVETKPEPVPFIAPPRLPEQTN